MTEESAILTNHENLNGPTPDAESAPLCGADHVGECDTADRQRERLDRISAAEAECAKQELVVEDLKARLKVEKEALDFRIAALRALCREPDQPELPFASGTAEAKEDDSWREVPLADALPSLTLSLHDMLGEAGFDTMGQLSDWLNANGGRRLTDLPGVGEAKAQKIEEAMTAFWERRKAQPTPAMPGTDEQEGE